MRRGMTLTSFLVAIIIGLALIAIVIVLYQRFILKQYVPVLTDVTSWEGGFNSVLSDGKTETACLSNSKCDGRPGWSLVVKSETLCPKDHSYACILTPNHRRDYFSPGSLILSDGDHDYKLPDTTVQKKGVGFPFTKKQEIAFFYIPHDALDKYADDTCTFTINGGSPVTVKDCYKAGEGFDGWVKLWNGTTEQFQHAFGSRPRNGYHLTMTVSRKGFDKTTTKEYILNVATT